MTRRGDAEDGRARISDKRLARFKPVKMPFDPTGLSARRAADDRPARDRVPRAREHVLAPERSGGPRALQGARGQSTRRSRATSAITCSSTAAAGISCDENQPFVGTTPRPPGHSLYPADLSRAAVDSYVAAHPGAKATLYDPYTVVRRTGAELTGRKYHDEYAPFAKGAADALRKAASLSPDPAFAKFLRLRADALLTDDYYASDVAWVDLKNPKVDIIFAPYETYLDDLLGVKTSYGASILIRNEAESRNLAKYQQWVPEIQDGAAARGRRIGRRSAAT